MLRAFGLTLLFTVGFTLINSIADGSQFYKTFKYYKRPGLWHKLKFGWMFCAVGAGWFLNDLIRVINYDVMLSAFMVLFFCLLRWFLHETFMEMWRS